MLGDVNKHIFFLAKYIERVKTRLLEKFLFILRVLLWCSQKNDFFKKVILFNQ